MKWRACLANKLGSALVALAALCSTVPAAAADDLRSANFENGEFGPLRLDFNRRIESLNGVASKSQLVDCSTTDYFCAKGDVFNLVLPKICADWRKGTVWEANGLSNRVLKVEDASQIRGIYPPEMQYRILPLHAYLIGDSARPGSVAVLIIGLESRADGGAKLVGAPALEAIFHATSGADLIKIAEEKGVEGLATAVRNGQAQNWRLSSGSVVRCRLPD